MFHCVFHCAFHCVTQRRARFTVRFTAFHSAARISLQPKVCRGKFPISNAIKSSSTPVNLQRVCENHPSLERKACKRLTTSLLAQHYETLLRDGLRCRCLIITSNSNSVFSSRASCQNQAHQLGPPQCRNAAAECYLCVLNCTKRDTLCQQRVQPRIQKLALANYQIPLSNAKQYLQKNTQCGLRFGSRFLTPKWGQSPRLIYFCNNNGADSHFGSRFPAPKMGANFESFFSYFNIDVETKTSGPTLKIKPSHSSFQSFRTCNQTFFHKSPIFSPKRQTGEAPSNGSSSVTNFNSHFWSCCLAIFESKNKNIKST